MEPSGQHQQQLLLPHLQGYQNPQQSPGLSRFRSAPSSLLANSLDGLDSKGLQLQPRFVSPNGNTSRGGYRNPEDDYSFSAAAHMDYQGHLPPQYPRQSSSGNALGVDSSYGLVGSAAMDHNAQAGTVSSNIMRQNSSPAGLFSPISVQNGYAAINGEARPSATRLKSQISFLSGGSSLGVLSQISEIGNEGVEANGPTDEKLENGGADAPFYGPAFLYGGSWNESSNFAQNFTVVKREQDVGGDFASANQNGEPGNRIHILSHHLSLPKPSSEMGAMEKILQFEDAVPCKIRAKRGCATHPRSIAERMRRTRISERMKKLQDLVPNMDKQTNTADMLDLAVEYIKNLQKQFKVLSESRAHCKCLYTQKPIPPR